MGMSKQYQTRQTNLHKAIVEWYNYHKLGHFRWKCQSNTRRGRQTFNKATVEYYSCHKLGHFQWECQSKEKETNYAESQEEMYGIIGGF